MKILIKSMDGGIWDAIINVHFVPKHVINTEQWIEV